MSKQVILVEAFERRRAGTPDIRRDSYKKAVQQKPTSLNFLGRWIQLHLHDTNLIARITAKFLAILFRPLLGQIESSPTPRKEDASLELPLRGVAFARPSALPLTPTEAVGQAIETNSRSSSPSTVAPSSSTSALVRIKPLSCEAQQPLPGGASSTPSPTNERFELPLSMNLHATAPARLVGEDSDVLGASPNENRHSQVVMPNALANEKMPTEEERALEMVRAKATAFLSLPLQLQENRSFQAKALQVNPLVGMLFPESYSPPKAALSEFSGSRGFHAFVERVLNSL